MGPAQTRTIDHDTQYEVGEKIRYCHSTITGWREDNEDAHVAVLDMNDGTGNSLFGVFDGHGGSEVSQYVAKYLAADMKACKAYKDGKWKEAFDTVFKNLDAKMRSEEGQKELIKIANAKKKAERAKAVKEDPEKEQNELIEVTDSRAGTTATCVLVTADKVICANTGDSRTVCARNWTTANDDGKEKEGESEAMSEDHKPENKEEKKRIELAGGFVSDGRVNAQLAVSRALGDFEFKCTPNKGPFEQQVTCEPDVREFNRADIQFVILGCDGVWDWEEEKSPQNACKFMVQQAYNKNFTTRKQQKAEEQKKTIIEGVEYFVESCCNPFAAGTPNSGGSIGFDNVSAILVEFL